MTTSSTADTKMMETMMVFTRVGIFVTRRIVMIVSIIVVAFFVLLTCIVFEVHDTCFLEI